MPDDIVLYQYPGDGDLTSVSPPCLKVHLALRIMGLEHRVENFRTSIQAARASPTGRVPVVTLGGRRIADSVAILDAVEAAHPERALSPSDPAARARDRLLEYLATDTLYWLGFYLRWVVPENRRRMLDAVFGSGFSATKLAARLILLPTLARRARGQGVAGLTKPDVIAAMRRVFDTVDGALQNGPFFWGRDRPGRGDVALASVAIQAGYAGVMPEAFSMIAERPALFDHVGRTLEAGGLPVPSWWSRETPTEAPP